MFNACRKLCPAFGVTVLLELCHNNNQKFMILFLRIPVEIYFHICNCGKLISKKKSQHRTKDCTFVQIRHIQPGAYDLHAAQHSSQCGPTPLHDLKAVAISCGGAMGMCPSLSNSQTVSALLTLCQVKPGHRENSAGLCWYRYRHVSVCIWIHWLNTGLRRVKNTQTCFLFW